MYTVQKANANTSNLRNAIRNAPSEELVSQRSVDHSAYTELVTAILDQIECITNREDINLNADQAGRGNQCLNQHYERKEHATKM